MRKALRVVLAAAALAACGPSADSGVPPADELEALRAELVAWHEASVAAHLEGDPAFFAGDLADDYLVISGARITRPDSAALLERFGAYLGSTAFSRYETTDGPWVGVSDDGSVGWVVVEVEVEGHRTGEAGDSVPVRFRSAWLNLFRRVDGRWRSVANVSQVAPS